MRTLENNIRVLNNVTGQPGASYASCDGKYKAQIGNYHLSCAYGGYALHQMSNEAGGVDDVFRSGHIPARELNGKIDAFIQGYKAKT